MVFQHYNQEQTEKHNTAAAAAAAGLLQHAPTSGMHAWPTRHIHTANIMPSYIMERTLSGNPSLGLFCSFYYENPRNDSRIGQIPDYSNPIPCMALVAHRGTGYASRMRTQIQQQQNLLTQPSLWLLMKCNCVMQCFPLMYLQAKIRCPCHYSLLLLQLKYHRS